MAMSDWNRRRLAGLAALTALAGVSACDSPTLSDVGDFELLISSVTPMAGGPGTRIDIEGIFPSSASFSICDIALTNVEFGSPMRAVVAPGIGGSRDLYATASGTLPSAIPPGQGCA